MHNRAITLRGFYKLLRIIFSLKLGHSDRAAAAAFAGGETCQRIAEVLAGEACDDGDQRVLGIIRGLNGLERGRFVGRVGSRQTRKSAPK